MSYFISNLRAQINCTEIYMPGKYGKKQLDRCSTSEEKLEKFLLAEPNSAEDVNDYVLFAQSLNALSNKKVYKKIEALLEYSKYSNKELRVARKIFRKAKMRKNFRLILKILICVISIALAVAWYVFYVKNWAGFWRVLWFFYVPILLMLPIALYYNVEVFNDKNPF